MYGLLLQSCADCLRDRFGSDVWNKIRVEVNIPGNVFSTHNIYSEKLMVEMAEAAAKGKIPELYFDFDSSSVKEIHRVNRTLICFENETTPLRAFPSIQVTDKNVDEIMYFFGIDFVTFVGQFGYDRILRVLGRHLRDFLNGLDNLHEYLRFSYPKLKPPSFFVEDETKNGLTLTYRSKRRGYLHYVRGQITQVSRLFYNTKVDIYVVANDYDDITKTTHAKFRLIFNNKAFREVANHVVDNVVDSIPLRSEIIFELFPFHIVFGRKMEIQSVGPGLRAVMPGSIGQSLVDLFNLDRPLTNFAWEHILYHTNNVFQLSSKKSFIFRTDQQSKNNPNNAPTSNESSDQKESEIVSDSTSCDVSYLSLKGQMMYISEWNSIMFLGTPQMNSLEDMLKSGLYINDLSMHDSSRDLVLAGTQQSAELKLALDQEQEKSRLLEHSMRKLDQEMQRTDALLYQMIPKPVADRLRKGEPSVATCQVFDDVTILFSDVVGFTKICSQITPMQVVSMLNAMYTQFDQLSENHSVYKVETIGDAYMAVSGAPIVTKYHALHMCNMALDMRESMEVLLNPANQESMQIRIGVHSGTVVAGVVGIKMPRYCLFGDTVNTASRMETAGEAMKIHISETTKCELEGFPYQVEKRGTIEVKGKGEMNTYWLVDKQEVNDADVPKCPFLAVMEDEVIKRQQDEIPAYGRNAALESEPGGLNFSNSPLTAYSPVSYGDISQISDVMKPKLPGSAGSHRESLTSPASLYRQRSNTVACPFSRVLSPQLTTDLGKSASPTLEASRNTNIPYSPTSQIPGVIQTSPRGGNKLSTSATEQYFFDRSLSRNPHPHTTSVSLALHQQKPSVPESVDSGILMSDNAHAPQWQKPRSTSDTPQPVSTIYSTSSRNLSTPQGVSREDSPNSQRGSRSHRTDGIARIVPIVNKVSDSGFESGNLDSSQTANWMSSQQTVKRMPLTSKGDDVDHLKSTADTFSTGNGSFASQNPKEEKWGTSTPNGTHVTGNDFDDVSISQTRQSKAQKKSKTCIII